MITVIDVEQRHYYKQYVSIDLIQMLMDAFHLDIVQKDINYNDICYSK